MERVVLHPQRALVGRALSYLSSPEVVVSYVLGNHLPAPVAYPRVAPRALHFVAPLVLHELRFAFWAHPNNSLVHLFLELPLLVDALVLLARHPIVVLALALRASLRFALGANHVVVFDNSHVPAVVALDDAVDVRGDDRVHCLGL